MALGEPRLDTIDDISGALDALHERLDIIAARMRMQLTESDVRELEAAHDDLDRIHEYFLSLRAVISDDYLLRMNRKRNRPA